MKKSYFRVFYWSLGIFISYFFNIEWIYYVFYFILIGDVLFSNTNIKNKMATILLYAVVLPDNYSAIGIAILISLIAICLKMREDDKYRQLLFLSFLVIFLVSFALNRVPLVNIFFAIIYFFPFFSLDFFFVRKWSQQEIEKVDEDINQILIIQIIATFFNYIRLQQNIFVGNDWSIGTLGSGQQSVLFIIFAFSFIRFLHDYNTFGKKRKNLIWMILSAVIMVTTNCDALFIILAVILAGMAIKALPLRKSMILILLTVGGVFLFVPQGVKDNVVKVVTDKEYRNYRISKLIVYDAAYHQIPKINKGYIFIGNGPGYFSSRAAATCTGVYVEEYNNYFNVSMSEETAKYVSPLLQRGRNYGSSDFGSVLALPHASAASIMGEYGVIGLCIIIAIFYLLQRKKNNYLKILIAFFIAICFLDSYMEYAKIIIFLFATFSCIEQKENDI